MRRRARQQQVPPSHRTAIEPRRPRPRDRRSPLCVGLVTTQTCLYGTVQHKGPANLAMHVCALSTALRSRMKQTSKSISN